MAIEHITFAIPSIRQSAQDIADVTGADPDFIVDKIGLKTRYILGPDETGVSLAAAACRRLFERIPELAGNVDLVVYVTQTPDQRIPHNSAQLVRELGLSNGTAAFDINLGCSGYVYGLNIAEGFLQVSGLTNALLVTCDPYSRIMAADDKNTNCVFGDAATATWLTTSSNRTETLATVFGTDGSGASAIELRAGGARKPFISLASENPSEYQRDDLHLHMKGRDVFNFAMLNVPSSIDQCLKKAGLNKEEIDYFVLHQGSRYLLDALANKSGIPQSKLLRNMEHYGNTVSSSIPLLLAEMDHSGRLDGAIVLLSGFGVGFSWATTIVKFKKRNLVS